MGAVTTLAATVLAAAGAVSLYRFVERKKSEMRKMFDDAKTGASKPSTVIDYERDPDSGVFKPKH